MKQSDRPSDDRMLEFLKDALDADSGVTEDTIDMLMTGYDIVQADTVEAGMIFDSFADAAVRGGTGVARQLRFEHGETVIDLELDDLERRLAGHFEPPGGRGSLEQIDGTTEISAPAGSFDLTVEGLGPFRVNYEVDGDSVVTAWLRFGQADVPPDVD